MTNSHDQGIPMKSFKMSALRTICFLLIVPQHGLAWGNAGHEAVVAVALQLKPELRPRLEAILKDLPSSAKWKQLHDSGLKLHEPYQTEKQNPDAWIKALATNPEKAATFPDWARDYQSYIPSKYDKWHYLDLDYDDPDDKRFVDTPNALTVLDPFENECKTASPGERAWALVWVLHLVGDLHQPLHDCSRALPNDHTKSDHGGNGVAYEGMKLHAFWDHLPDHSAQNNPSAYAGSLVAYLKKMKKKARDEFNAKANDLQPEHWVREGHDLMTKIGYPSDAKFANYDVEAHRIADGQILLAGA